jgi:bifunctional DNA-binding transcriptional regulator/antitoxin component of YhaV-PrlF toxin-antitoxin module
MGTSLTITTDSDLELGKAVRESLHLADGDRVVVEQRDGEVVLRREEPGAGSVAGFPRIFQEKGTWVFSAGQPSDYSVRDILNELHDERAQKFLGE